MILNNINDFGYEAILDDVGFNTFVTDTLVGELRAIKFNIVDSVVLSPFTVKVYVDDIKIMDEQISISQFYILKKQPQDGFNQHWSMSNEFFTLNESVRVEVDGVPDNSLFITFRMKEV